MHRSFSPLSLFKRLAVGVVAASGSPGGGRLNRLSGLSVLWRPAGGRFGSQRATLALGSSRLPSHQGQWSVSIDCMATKHESQVLALRSLSGLALAVPVTTTVALSAGSVFAASGKKSVARAWPSTLAATRPGLGVRQRPNTSIEGTCNIRLRLLSHAPHVKR